MQKFNTYQTPLSTRYCSKEMSHLFSPEYKYQTWRKLWTALAKAQKKLGIPIEKKQIDAMEKKISSIDFEQVEEIEKKVKHDVMAHLHAFGQACPDAQPVMHLGSTSTFLTDNTDLIQMREGLKILRKKCHILLRHLATFSKKYAALPTLSYTHLQPAQPTTVGKRGCLWLQDFLLDFQDLLEREESLHFLGVKGATGTQASFLALFDGNASKVKQLDSLVSKEFGFEKVFGISSQTYTRKQDIKVVSTLASFAASAHKCATDIRLLAHLKEMDEPFDEKTQVGSSAMPHKRNPMLCERICGLSRFLISLNENPSYTLATQWLERSLDDSANRRIVIPEAFLTADALLNLLIRVTSGLVVYPKMIEKHLAEELPFLALEMMMIEAVKKGKDRLTVHELLRKHSVNASRRIKQMGKSNDLISRIIKDPEIGLTKKEIQKIMSADRFYGLAKQQVHDFLEKEVNPLLKKFKDHRMKFNEPRI